MKLRFTKMQGAGNDFVMLDGTAEPLALSDAQLQHLADRRFGIGADQILVVEPSDRADVDFRYRIFNGASGDEVEQCGNGARCFVHFVRARGLTNKRHIRVQTRSSLLELQLQDDGRVSVDMGAPVFEPQRVPFDADGLVPPQSGAAIGNGVPRGGFALWPLDVGDQSVELAVLSMGNPHAVLIVENVDSAPVESLGPSIGRDPRFPRGANVGFMQIVDRSSIRLRVYERGAGETLACGTGACAAVVAGIELGLLEHRVEVAARGGALTIEWSGGQAPVLMTGPAVTVFEGGDAPWFEPFRPTDLGIRGSNRYRIASNRLQRLIVPYLSIPPVDVSSLKAARQYAETAADMLKAGSAYAAQYVKGAAGYFGVLMVVPETLMRIQFGEGGA